MKQDTSLQGVMFYVGMHLIKPLLQYTDGAIGEMNEFTKHVES